MTSEYYTNKKCLKKIVKRKNKMYDEKKGE